MRVRKLKGQKLEYANRVIQKACDFSGVPMNMVLSQSRVKEYAIVRHAIAYSLRSAMGLSHAECATVLGRINHTTSVHSYQFVSEQMVAARRSDEMDFMVDLAKRISKYISQREHIENKCDRYRQSVIASMRDSRCSYYSVAGIMAEIELSNSILKKRSLK